jgi:ribosomal-protein-serine acetyltransferase
MRIEIDEKLRLELIEEKHADHLFNLINISRPYLKQWLPWVDFTITVDNTKDYIVSSLKRHSENNGFDCAIIFNNEVAGIIGLRSIDNTNKITSIGYWLGENFQGRGIMTKACKALTDYCFDTLNLNRVVINCSTENLKSQAIPKRLNFKKEGTIRQGEFLNGKFVDYYLYSRLRNE